MSVSNSLSILKTALFLLVIGIIIYGCENRNTTTSLKSSIEKRSQLKLDDEPIIPLPTVTLDSNKVLLGKKLFFDKRLSKDNTISCSSCHDLSKGGADGLKVPIGIDNQKGVINAPSVFNAAYNFRQFWNGRAKTLEDQIDGPIHSSIEMGTNWDEITSKLKLDNSYVNHFKEVGYPFINKEAIKSALSYYQKSLTSPSRFDRYLKGEIGAITSTEKSGYQLFKQYGCSSCHQGINVGGNTFAKFGIIDNYFENRGNITNVDRGRFNATGRETDMFVFKVPSLRNVALTSPYFHDGSVDDLEEAVNVMARYQLGRSIPDEDVKKIVAFLNALTGENFEE